MKKLILFILLVGCTQMAEKSKLQLNLKESFDGPSYKVEPLVCGNREKLKEHFAVVMTNDSSEFSSCKKTDESIDANKCQKLRTRLKTERKKGLYLIAFRKVVYKKEYSLDDLLDPKEFSYFLCSKKIWKRVASKSVKIQ